MNSSLGDVVAEVMVERLRQVAQGFDAAHDDAHYRGELAQAAAVYALKVQQDRSDYADELCSTLWPWVDPVPATPGTPAEQRETLIRAAALLVAEIERFDRCELT